VTLFDRPVLDFVLLIPAIACIVLALVPGYRLGAAINVLASGATFLASVLLVIGERTQGEVFIIDDFNIYLVTLTAFVGFTTAIFSASYIGHEIEISRLPPVFLRFYHALYQAMLCAMNVALTANNIGLLWVGVEVATLSTVMMVGIYRTPEAVEAAWKYFILGSVGIALAFFGTILIYLAAQETLGEGLQAMAWNVLRENAAKLDPKLLSLAFVFLLVGYGTKVGLAPFHAWLPDAHAEGPTPISAVLSGLLLNVALYALLRFKMIMNASPGTLNVGAIMIVLGLISLLFAAFMLYRRRDIKRLFAYSSIEHMGIMTFAFGIGGPLANFAGLLHMTMHSLTKSAIFFGLAAGIIAISGLPPFGVFTSEFMLVSSSFARQPALAVILVIGLIVAFGALVWRMQNMLFGEPTGPVGHVKASYIPMFIHLAIVLAAGIWLPEPVVRWFKVVAAQLG
jgi:hydrogenase-4 component F